MNTLQAYELSTKQAYGG